jgi:hypothetical protein
MVTVKREPVEEDSSFFDTLPPAHSLSRKFNSVSESEDLDVKDGKISGPESSERPWKRRKLECVLVRHFDEVLSDERKAKEMKAKIKLFKNVRLPNLIF